MKRKKSAHDWQMEAAWYQRLTAALVHKIGGTVNISQEELKQAVEKGVEVANLHGNVSLRVPLEHQSRILVP